MELGAFWLLHVGLMHEDEKEIGAEKEVRHSTQVQKPPPSTLQSIQEEIEGNLNETDSLLTPSASPISPPSTVTNSSTSVNTWLWDDDQNYDDDIDFFQRDIEDALKVAKSKGKKTKDSGPGNDDLGVPLLPVKYKSMSKMVLTKPYTRFVRLWVALTALLLERAYWDNLIIGAHLAANQKMVVPVEILVMEDWYMENL
ncbi:hypothetical protein M422DRAFT_783712 [Sphaerobolus stellatus SS14]|uniref:Uncharacterized protein n=1 Tax=Sphaerobolus stellatus (strain SS14) TaxID=990650 RepID=A0A0C9UAW3_SPHS4|nr:hypothetical protein M422DRAFT_783712 [Sphaerobolus stellatus SS14]